MREIKKQALKLGFLGFGLGEKRKEMKPTSPLCCKAMKQEAFPEIIFLFLVV